MAEAGKIDPMHQFTVEPLVPLNVAGYDISFTNSSLWLLLALAIIFGFMAMGMGRQLVPNLPHRAGSPVDQLARRTR